MEKKIEIANKLDKIRENVDLFHRENVILPHEKAILDNFIDELEKELLAAAPSSREK